MKKKAVILIFAIFLLENIYSANTSLRISDFSRNITLNYDLKGGAEIIQTLTVKHKGDSRDFFLTFQSGSSGQWTNRTVVNGGSILNYQIYRDSSKIDILKDIPDNPSGTEIVSGSFPQSSTFQFITISYTIHVPTDQFDIAGVYSDTFDVILYSGNLSAYTQEDVKSHTIKVTMPASLELSITPTGVPFNETSTSVDLNFGILSAGSSRSADAVIRTNSPYSVLVLSENGGRLVHADPAISDIVPYTFLFNGTVTDLSGITPVQVVTGAAITPWEGSRYPMEITISDFGMAAKGQYSDNITLTIQAQ
ncbi:MAG: spore coat protein U domain-containing protein [Spirochaetaceae bacterium]|nr:spore coat protein U domain-containing protein [Spirochaetaceae bacterium]